MVNTALPLLWQEFMMCFITKVKHISYINSKCHIKKLKSGRTYLIGYSGFISREWFLIAWGYTHTRMHAHAHTHARTHINFLDKSNFKKPGTCLV